MDPEDQDVPLPLAPLVLSTGLAVFFITAVSDVGIAQSPPILLRPLAEYEAAIGGGF